MQHVYHNHRKLNRNGQRTFRGEWQTLTWMAQFKWKIITIIWQSAGETLDTVKALQVISETTVIVIDFPFFRPAMLFRRSFCCPTIIRSKKNVLLQLLTSFHSWIHSPMKIPSPPLPPTGLRTPNDKRAIAMWCAMCLLRFHTQSHPSEEFALLRGYHDTWESFYVIRESAGLVRVSVSGRQKGHAWIFTLTEALIDEFSWMNFPSPV